MLLLELLLRPSFSVGPPSELAYEGISDHRVVPEDNPQRLEFEADLARWRRGEVPYDQVYRKAPVSYMTVLELIVSRISSFFS